ncbi:hypothetical protein ABH926_005347 [Catenulispora sp. GP43]|uniref:hypothetical protein n=1 Tax=Catenulispora sp. GP43 TaxID=3156263 RepID=UPI0035118B84
MSLVTDAAAYVRARRDLAPALTPSTVLISLATVPALLVTAWLVATFPLVWVGQFRIYTALPLFAVLAAVLLRFGLPPVLRAAATLRTPWWPVAATVLIAAAFLLFAAATHSEQVVLHRDNGSYAQIGYLLAHNGGLDRPVPTGAFGDSSSLVTYDSPAFYRVGSHLVPQFMTGWPTMVAAGWWIGGWSGELVMPALVGAAAILALAGLAARLAGPRWAPLAALVTAVAFPVLKNSQTTFSEMPALLLLGAAVLLLGEIITAGTAADAGTTTGGADISGAAAGTPTNAPVGTPVGTPAGAALPWPFAFIAGLVLGVGELVRLDLLLDMALLMPVAAWLWATRRNGIGPWLAGAFAGLALGLLDARFLSWPYVKTNASSVKLATAALALSCLVCLAAAAWIRRRGIPQALWRLVPAAGASAAALIGVALLVRPYVSTARGDANSPSGQYLISLQTWAGLAPDGSRTYAEQSLRWVSWYVGWPLLAAALAGAVVLTWRVLHGRELRWAAALPVYVLSAALQLWRPSITPDHPYADRRLVTVVLPGVILMAVWTASAATRAVAEKVRSRQRTATGSRRLLTPVAVTAVGAAVMSVLFVVPAAAATAPVAAKRTELGEVAATRTVCRALSPSKDSVVLVDPMSGQWMATIRNQCQVPVALLSDADATKLAHVTAGITAAGRTPVIAASSADPLRALGFVDTAVKKAVALSTMQDQQQIVKRPTGTKTLYDIAFWYTRPQGH